MHNNALAQPAVALDTRTIMEAIAKRLLISATYNGTDSKMAPHALYTRAGELYLAAIVVERNGVPPRERKLGIFKLTGMSKLGLERGAFEPDPLFDPTDERFATTTLFAVER